MLLLTSVALLTAILSSLISNQRVNNLVQIATRLLKPNAKHMEQSILALR